MGPVPVLGYVKRKENRTQPKGGRGMKECGERIVVT
jgi:hypothetical protein